MKHKIQSRGLHSEMSPRALDKWNPAIQAAVENTSDTITVYGVIGEDWYGEGVTLKRIDAALRAIGERDVTVYINSPGGDMFEGIAIYNRLREHSNKVTTKVLGMAASAASIIYLAGSTREVASSGFLMIHNCWTYLAGNRHYLIDVAADMTEFDAAMADLYAETSGQTAEDMAELMDDETYIRGKRAVELGLATGLVSATEITERETEEIGQANALKAMDIALAKAGMPRSERRELFANFKSGMPRAAGGGTGVFPWHVNKKNQSPRLSRRILPRPLSRAAASLKMERCPSRLVKPPRQILARRALPQLIQSRAQSRHRQKHRQNRGTDRASPQATWAPVPELPLRKRGHR